MVSNQHYVELWIHGEQIELESQESLGLRINSKLFDPTKTSTTQAEYSYSFSIPSTPNNDRILDYANNLCKANKFRARYKAQIVADGNTIYDGSLTIRKYNAKDKMYECNLVNIKINTLDEIFGESVLTDLHWDVDYDGVPTINEINQDYDSKYFFPLVAYGVFQKTPYYRDEVGGEYTSKHVLDKYNKWWHDAFFPSLNVVETLRRCFTSKGYAVGGSVFSDPYISKIYASCNLAEEQSPDYNVGNPKFGRVLIEVDWNNYESVEENFRSFGHQSMSFANSTGGFPQDLKFPYNRVKPAMNASNFSADLEQFNFSTVDVWNMCDKTNNPSGVSINVLADTYMYDPDESLFVIPSDGWYKISLSAIGRLSGAGTTFEAEQWTNTFIDQDEFKQRKVQIKRSFKEHTPLEIQLIRNYDENIELIKGKKNIEYATGDPNQTEYHYEGGSYTSSSYTNKSEWDTDFPHQNCYGAKLPTKYDSLINTSVSQRQRDVELLVENLQGQGLFTDYFTTDSTVHVTVGNMSFGGQYGALGGNKDNLIGYMHKDGYVMPFDQAVTDSFICGLSTMSMGTASVMRDGRSWSKMCTLHNDIFAQVKGMDICIKENDGYIAENTKYCENYYRNSDNYCFIGNPTQPTGEINQLNGQVQCCVYLKKNDVLQLVALQRDFDGQKYSCSAHVEVLIEAISSRSKEELKADNSFNFFTQTEMPTKLNLFNFTNKETKISDWINNIQKAFNLEIVQDGNQIGINTNQGIKKNITAVVNIDDRASSDEAVSEFISYPREMSVKYKVNTEEYGFELTVPQEHIDDEDWANYGDSGYTVIQLNDDSYETQTQNTQTNFSYCWYDNFKWNEVFEDGTEAEHNIWCRIPVIEKSEYMADGYGYEEAMKHDGYSFTQRFWYRDQVSQEYVWTSDHMHEQVALTYPINNWFGFNLSYKDTEKSIVSEYFNIHPMLSSNYVNVDVYLSPEEYNSIKGGALVKYDDDLHYTAEISGFDPQGGNTTSLKLIKKP